MQAQVDGATRLAAEFARFVDDAINQADVTEDTGG